MKDHFEEIKMTPDDRKYTKTHEWVRIEEDIAIVGISDHAQDALGDITFVEFPDIGQSVEAHDECAVIESVKAASDLCAPLSGIIKEINDVLADSPERINQDPYDDGWIFRLANIDVSDLEELMDASQYEAMLNENAE